MKVLTANLIFLMTQPLTNCHTVEYQVHDILLICRKHHYYGTGMYSKLYKAIKNKTAIDLLYEGFDYHSSCQTFNLDAYNLAKKEKCNKQPSGICQRKVLRKERRFTRSQVNYFDVTFFAKNATRKNFTVQCRTLRTSSLK